MQEKVIIVTDGLGISSYNASAVNQYLENGWTVKSVNIAAESEHTTAIFVICKE